MSSLMGDNWDSAIRNELKNQAPGTGAKCYNCQETGHAYYNCNKEPICKFCKLEGHKAPECPTAPYCQYCLMTGHIERRCRRKEAGEPRRLTPYVNGRGKDETRGGNIKGGIGSSTTGDKTGQEGGQRNLPGAINRNEKEDLNEMGDLRPLAGAWDTKERLKAAMKFKNNRVVVTVQMGGGSIKRKPLQKEVRKVIEQRGVDKNKVIGAIYKLEKAEICFKDAETANSFLFDFPVRAGPDMWAKSARRGDDNMLKVTFKEVPWNVPDSVILGYAKLWGEVLTKDGLNIMYGRDEAEGDEPAWKNGNRTLWMNIKKSIPTKNIIQGNMVEVEHFGQQECYNCKFPPDKCKGNGKSKQCVAKKGSWKEALRERLKDAGCDISDMEGADTTVDIENDSTITGEETELVDIIELEKEEELEYIKIVGMKNIEHGILWQLIRRRMEKAAENKKDEEKEQLKALLDEHETEWERIIINFDPYPDKIEWGDMTIEGEKDDLMRTVWMGITLMRDALYIRMEPRYKNTQLSPMGKGKEKKGITPLDKLEEEIKALEAKMKKKKKKEKTSGPGGSTYDEDLNSDEDENKNAELRKNGTPEIAINRNIQMEIEEEERKKRDKELEETIKKDRELEEAVKNEHKEKERIEKERKEAEERDLEKQIAATAEEVKKLEEEEKERQAAESRKAETGESAKAIKNTTNIHTTEPANNDFKRPIKIDTPRISRPESKTRCSTCKICKYRCETCDMCKAPPTDGGQRKGCVNRERCKTPREQKGRQARSESSGSKRPRGLDVEKTEQENERKVPKMINSLEATLTPAKDSLEVGTG